MTSRIDTDEELSQRPSAGAEEIADIASLDGRVSALEQTLARLASDSLNKKCSRELGEMLRVWSLVDAPRKSQVLLLEAAAVSLARGGNGVPLAKELTRQVRKTVVIPRHTRLFRRIFPEKSPTTWMMGGLGALLSLSVVVAYFVLTFTLSFFVTWDLTNTQKEIFWVAGAGWAGGIVSILMRAQRLNSKPHEIDELEVPALFWTGLLKPVIGVIFAFFVYAALKSGIVTFTVAEGKLIYLYVVIAFIAGFSERFVPDLISTIEKRVNTAPSTHPSVG